MEAELGWYPSAAELREDLSKADHDFRCIWAAEEVWEGLGDFLTENKQRERAQSISSEMQR